MAIELHLCEGGDFHTTTDFVECGNCSAIIANVPNGRDTVRCETCGEEQDTDEIPDARVEEIVQAVVDAANLKEERDRLRAALEKIANMVKPGDMDAELSDEMGEPTEVEDWTIDEAYTTGTTCIELARAALGEE